MIFELIRDPSRTLGTTDITLLEAQLLDLYQIRGWTMPLEEIEETMEKAKMIIVVKKGKKVCGFFAARRYSAAGYETFYYLERLIIHPHVRLHTLVPLAILLVSSLPGFGREELKICAISRLKVVSSLVRFFGPDFFCSPRDIHDKPQYTGRAGAYLKALSEKQNFTLNREGLLKNVFNPDFTHDNDRRIISSQPALSQYDAAFLMNTIPAAKHNIFKNFFNSREIASSRFIYSIVENLHRDQLFTKTAGRPA